MIFYYFFLFFDYLNFILWFWLAHFDVMDVKLWLSSPIFQILGRYFVIKQFWIRLLVTNKFLFLNVYLPWMFNFDPFSVILRFWELHMVVLEAWVRSKFVSSLIQL